MEIIISQLLERAVTVGMYAVFMALVATLFIRGCAKCLRELWNDHIRDIFNAEEITYTQATCIQVVPLILATPVLVLVFLFNELKW